MCFGVAGNLVICLDRWANGRNWGLEPKIPVCGLVVLLSYSCGRGQGFGTTDVERVKC